MRKLIIVAAVLASSVASQVSATVVSIAVYNQATSGSTVRWVRAPGGTGGQLYTIASSGASTPGAATVNFTFLQAMLAPLGALAAKLTLNATSPQAAVPIASFLTQQALTGNFAFTYSGAAPLVVGQTTYLTGANLLSGTFNYGTIVGPVGGTAGAFSASTGGGSTIVLASDFFDFSNSTSHDITLGLSALSSPFAKLTAQSALSSFRATTGGSFASDGATITANIPEPASWALMIAGFGLLGATMRRRRQHAVAA